MIPQRLPRQARVRARADFDRTFADCRRTAAPELALHWRRDDAPARIGLAVSRKVDRRAVGRNRIKRALRECFRRLRHELAGGDYVVVARSAAASCDGPALQRAFEQVLRRAGALPVPDTAGTMPAARPPS